MEHLQVPTLTFRLPSGMDITIREQNGEDEDILSRYGDIKDSISHQNFLSAIIIGSSKEGKTKFTPDDISKWPAVDKYYALVKSRIFSLGKELKFKYKCSNNRCGKETPLVEDLDIYDWDLSKGNPPEDDPYYESRIKLLPNGDKLEFEETLSNGKRIKFGILTGMGESKTLKKSEDDLNRNDDLRARNLSYFREEGNQWIEVANFRMFSSKIMSEIRNLVNKHNENYPLITKCKCRHCGNTEDVVILTLPSFFFPSEI